MDTTERSDRWRAMLSPRSIAIVGDSERQSSWARLIRANLDRHGFSGPIYPVNPNHTTLWGQRCYSSLTDIETSADLAVILVRAELVPRIAAECVEANVQAGLVIASGFSDAPGPEGQQLEESLVQIARESGLLVIGPNCEGFVSAHDSVAAYVPQTPETLVPGGWSMVSQSGTVLWSSLRAGHDRGLGYNHMISCGGQAVLNLSSYLEFMLDDPRTRVMSAYVEAIRDSSHFCSVARRALEIGKPLVVLKPGRSEAARRSIIAHSGALAGSHRAFDAICRRYGIARVDDLDSMLETVSLLLRRRSVRAQGIAAVCLSGGAATLMAEAASGAGLDLAPLAPNTEARLRRALPDFGTAQNPLDATGPASADPGLYIELLEIVAAQRDIGVVVVDNRPPRPGHQLSEQVMEWLERQTDLAGPLFVPVDLLARAYDDVSQEYQRGSRLPFLQGPARAARAIGALMWFQESHRRALRSATDLNSSDKLNCEGSARAVALHRALGVESNIVSESVARPLLKLYGIQVPPGALASSVESAVAIARRTGYPVVLKGESSSVSHRRQAGLILLDLRSEVEIKKGYATIQQRARAMSIQLKGVLVERLVNLDGVEVLVGVIRDPQYGPQVVIALGGSAVEMFDVATLVKPPVREGDLARAVRGTLLEHVFEYLGNESYDVLSDVISALYSLWTDAEGRVETVEINPLLLPSTDSAPMALDCLITLRARREPGFYDRDT
ncbi:MAG: acetate--CoA ligase family protein [bacterium]